MTIQASKARLSALTAYCIVLTACGGGDDGAPATENPPEQPPTAEEPSPEAPSDEVPPPSVPPPTEPTGNEPPSAVLPPDEPPPAEVPPAEVENSAPTIHGSPAAAVLYDTLYQFTPEADDADGDVLHFSVTNAPPWATFEPASGKLAGTPRAEYIGATYDDIVISVSDGAAEAQLEGFSIGVQAWADGAIELSWVAPTENTDGSPLTYSVSFMIYWGTESGEYLNEISVPAGLDRYVVEDLVPDTYYFVVTAIGPDGEESEYSEEAYVTVT